MFCFCPAARYCVLIGQAVTIRNREQGGASHTADLNNKRAVGPHAAMGAGKWEHPVQAGTAVYSGPQHVCFALMGPNKLKALQHQ